MSPRTLTAMMTAALLGAGCGEETLRPGGGRVARVELTAPARSLEVGASLQLTATPRGEDGAALPDRALAWTSSDTAVASVSRTGLVSARAAGTATIIAASEGRSGRAEIAVRPQAVAWIQIAPAGGEIPIEHGSTRQLTATARAVGGAELPGRPVVWSSSDTTVVAVGAAGLLEARGAGTVVVTATSEGKAARVQVRAYTVVERVDVSPRTASAAVGESVQLTATPRASSGLAVDRQVTWTSSDPSVASVDAAGRVTAVSAGTAAIRAASQTRTATVYLTVGTRWREQALLGVGGAALPATLYTTTRSVQGVQRAVRFDVTEGRLRTLGSRYQVQLHGWLRVEGAAAVQATMVSRGEILYQMSEGYRSFLRDGTEPGAPAQYREQVRPDGKALIIGRPEPDAPEAVLLFEAP